MTPFGGGRPVDPVGGVDGVPYDGGQVTGAAHGFTLAACTVAGGQDFGYSSTYRLLVFGSCQDRMDMFQEGIDGFGC